jgi:hypothetical protein
VSQTDLDGDQGLTRRRLVQAGGAAAVGLMLGAAPASGAAIALPGTTPAYLRRASYARLKGTALTTTGASGANVTLRLAEVADLARARVERSYVARDDAFSLTLTGPRGAPLSGSVHELRHASLGTFSLFLVPVGRPTKTEQSYEVVVDRSMTIASAKALAPR